MTFQEKKPAKRCEPTDRMVSPPEKPRQKDVKRAAQSRTERERQAVAEGLRTMIRDCAVERFGLFPEDKSLELNIKLQVQPSAGWALSFDPPLAEQIQDQVESAETDWNVYRPGRVYCFRCEGSSCEHAKPGSSLEVFQGYDPVGSPRWTELTQSLLDLGDERVDLLFGRRPAVVTRIILGKTLRTRQLRPFGRSSRTYALLGQVIAGYFLVGRPGSPNRERIAITFQAVAVRDAKGRTTLELNMLYGPGDLPEAPNEAMLLLPRVDKARGQAMTALKKLEERVRNLETNRKGGEARQCLQRVPGILRKLAASLAQGDRQARRRTVHAQDRRAIQRPVDKAMADLRAAGDWRLFHDLKTKAIAVCGDKGRCHIFSEEGKHVTSFTITPDSVQGRIKKKRWDYLDRDKSRAFLQKVLDLSE